MKEVLLYQGTYVSPTAINVENLEQEYMKIMVLWDVMPYRVEDTLFQRNALHTAILKTEAVEPPKW